MFPANYPLAPSLDESSAATLNQWPFLQNPRFVDQQENMAKLMKSAMRLSVLIHVVLF